MKNVKTEKIKYSVDSNDIRTEETVSINEKSIHLFCYLEKYTDVDISDPDEKLDKFPTPDAIACICENGFFDSDGDGLCDTANCGLPEKADRSINRNPYISTKEVYIENCPGLTVIFPNTPQFSSMKVYVDQNPVFWQKTGSVTVPKE